MNHDCVFCALPQWDSTEQFVLGIEPLNPVVPGHRIFIPRCHAVNAASDPEVTALTFVAASRYAFNQNHDDFNLITSAGRAATQTVFHLHVHYVPRHEADGLSLPWTGQVR